MIQLLIVALSVASLGCVRAILRAPWLPEHTPPTAPLVLAPVLDEGYFDTRGLI